MTKNVAGYYEIDGRLEHEKLPGDQFSKWTIMQDGVPVAVLYGPASLSVALAACENLNSNFQWDGWIHRAQNYMTEKTVPDSNQVDE